MKKSLFLLFFLSVFTALSQNITVDSQTYTPQQLIEDILIDSNCISNVTVTNAVSGDFGTNERSYGFFDANGSTFPFQSGIVMSTGQLNRVPGPNTSLSDDDGNNWTGDSDLEFVLNESNTFNATLLEFNFTATANQISFRYLFASEEYQEGNPNTCNFSDLFGFLIRPETQQQWENIALIPNTQTPVKVTTVHSGIPGACNPINEIYFGSWNDSNYQPINFNGQTEILTATANTVANTVYNVKLVIADEFNFRFDSAVFLEAGSFELNTDLGPDLLQATNNALCEGDSVSLTVTQQPNSSYTWLRDGTVEVLNCLDCNDFVVSTAGTYNVEITDLITGCISYGEVIIETVPLPIVNNTTLIECDIDQNGLTNYNLLDANTAITNQDPNLFIQGFYVFQTDAELQINPIITPESFDNTVVGQTVFASVTNTNTNCTVIASIGLDISTNTLILQDFDTCDDAVIDGFATFDLNEVTNQITPLVPTNANIQYYETIDNAFAETNELPSNFENTIVDSQTIFVKVSLDTGACYTISEITLNILFTQTISEDEEVLYCLNSFPETITLFGGVLNDSPSNYYYQWSLNNVDTGVTTSFNNVNETGTYTVTITHPNGCSNSRNITVIPVESPIIDSIDFTELTANNTITVNTSNTGNFEYALDNPSGFYQDSNVFTNVAPGIHTVYVRDIEGCGSDFKEFSILGFPKFFTPNNDFSNDVWKPIGSNQQFNNNLQLQVFNRYGKLLKATNALNGWDGTFKGLSLPSDDYWYIITKPDGTKYSGHFALVR